MGILRRQSHITALASRYSPCANKLSQTTVNAKKNERTNTASPSSSTAIVNFFLLLFPVICFYVGGSCAACEQKDR